VRANPFRIVVDTREQQPYTFKGLSTGGKPIAVPLHRGVLHSGDYSIQGFEGRVAVERKSLSDLYSTLGQRRKQFEAEHRRLQAFEFAAVVVEASWSQIRAGIERSGLHGESVWRTGLAWAMRYGVHWYAMDSRRQAEEATFRLLERYWTVTFGAACNHLEPKKEASRVINP
jgi:DNA excision repair protein ERCC-4